MSPDDPRHGRYAGVIAHARAGIPECDPCIAARRKAQSRASNLRKLGHKGFVDATPVRRHIDALIAAGMTTHTIASRAGVSDTTVLHAGRQHLEMHYLTAEAIFGVRATPYAQGLVSAVGTLRRLQALATLGWSITAIHAAAEELGVDLTLSVIRYVLRRLDPRVRVRTRDAVTTVYDHLSMRLPEPGRAVSLTRGQASKRGYLPPLAWDDIDDPNEVPEGWEYAAPRRENQHNRRATDPVVVMRLLEGERVPSTPEERSAAMEQWIADGGSRNELASWHGWKPERYTLRLRLVQGGAA